jgi:hypothetical protein
MYGSSVHFWDNTFKRTNYVLIWTKNGWATFLATFSQTHLGPMSAKNGVFDSKQSEIMQKFYHNIGF